AWISLDGGGSEAVNFGGSFMRIGRRKRLLRDPRLVRLGPDILADDFDPAAAIARMRRLDQRTELGEAVLDQSAVAGIGNIFKSEGSFEVRIDPNRRLESLGDEQIADLLGATRDLMLGAVESGRHPKRVYRRAGEPCPRCGGRVRSRAQGDDARTSYWCPDCQTC